MTPEIGLESKNIVPFIVQKDGEIKYWGAHPDGTSEFEKFVRDQRVQLRRKIDILRVQPPTKIKHGGRFKSLTEMRDAYAGRDTAIALAERKLGFLQTGGECGEAMEISCDENGSMVRFEVVKLD